MKNRLFATATLFFAIAFGWKMSEILKAHTCWCDFVQPPGVGEVLFALVCGLLAIAAAIGVDVRNLLREFGIGGMDRVEDKKD